MNIEELYRTYFDIVYRYIRSVSRDGALAEEVTQETFFKALKKADQFRDDCDVRVWLCQIAKNTLYDHLKKQKKQLPGEEQPETAEAMVEKFLRKSWHSGVRLWRSTKFCMAFRNRIKKFFPCGHSESLSLVRSECFLEKVKTGRG